MAYYEPKEILKVTWTTKKIVSLIFAILLSLTLGPAIAESTGISWMLTVPVSGLGVWVFMYLTFKATTIE